MRPSGPESLFDLQRRVLSPLTRGTPVDERGATGLFRQPPKGTVAERWHIYGAGYFARLSESLENDYPAIRRIIGRDAFDSMVRRYVLDHTPRSFDLGRAGDRLAGFLGTDWLSTKLPFLPDLAQLEWKLAEASQEGEIAHCYGVNKCKGVGDCGGPGHSCAGQNACNRQGYLDMEKDLCLKIDGGRLTAE